LRWDGERRDVEARDKYIKGILRILASIGMGREMNLGNMCKVLCNGSLQVYNHQCRSISTSGDAPGLQVRLECVAAAGVAVKAVRPSAEASTSLVQSRVCTSHIG